MKLFLATALCAALVGCAGTAEDDDMGGAEALTAATALPTATCQGGGHLATTPIADARRPTQTFDVVLKPGAAYVMSAMAGSNLSVSAVLSGTGAARTATPRAGHATDVVIGNASETAKTYRVTVERAGAVLASSAYDFSGTCRTIKAPGTFGLPENDVCIMGQSYDFQTDFELEKHDCWAPHTNLADPKAGGIELGNVR